MHIEIDGSASLAIEQSDPSRLVGAPLVSVVMVTYNHAAWVGKAIQGIVEQDCPFEYELIIGEDCSTDQTLEIVLDYQRRYPNLIRVVRSDRNVGAWANHDRSLRLARGEFLAFCEGDDYWCHRGKLAAQVALLQEDMTAAIAHADWVRAAPRGVEGWKVAWGKSMHGRMSEQYLRGDLFHIFYFGKILRTCTVMLRRSAMQAFLDDRLSIPRYRFGDAVSAAYFTSRWRVAYWPEVAAVYRESPRSLLRSGLQSKIAFLKSSLEFDSDARRYFSDRPDYPRAYRWEVSIGLVLWAIRARDADAALFALRDIRAHFTVRGFIAAGWKTLRIRLPMRVRQRRERSRDAGLQQP